MTLEVPYFTHEEIMQLRQDTQGAGGRVHLDNCGSSLMPKPVITAQIAQLNLEAQFGGYVAQEQQLGALESVYASISTLIECSVDDVALTTSAVDAWTKAFYSIPMSAGDTVITSPGEYCSNYVAFLHRQKNDGIKIRVAEATVDGGVNIDHLESLIDESTKLISLTHIPSSSGAILPAYEVGAIARQHNVLFLLDTCQSIGQIPVNVKDIGCDIATATGRKFLRGPRGVGFLYMNSRAREGMNPVVMTNQGAAWDSHNTYKLRSDARVFEAWERSAVNILGLGAAVEYMQSLGVNRTTGQTLHLGRSLRQQLRGIKGVRIECPSAAEAAIITFNKTGYTAAEIKKHMEQQNIAVQIASVVHTRLDLEARGIDSAVRVSPHYYNNQDDYDRFLTVLEDM
ncbi:aminotransferase class V-fold PLP-dependent enzyme [Kordiimonas pumila]|uniref:Aminotransferase class V-fold PLP-dependent enzyme n=1 Tax=Kordiimonas pumila TaxID=2161677 RepID=A0ABV7D3B3_9PROT|nr:aminotransferase class V-fold PLP-dependent enzyme [Kordiimonas pumila]